jgi:hypothetical protein
MFLLQVSGFLLGDFSINLYHCVWFSVILWKGWATVWLLDIVFCLRYICCMWCSESWVFSHLQAGGCHYINRIFGILDWMMQQPRRQLYKCQ